MTAQARISPTAGLWGPVAVFGGLLLLLAAPVMRGGNRYAALIPLELLGLLILLALWGAWLEAPVNPKRQPLLLLLLLLSPLLLALVQLVPLPTDLWNQLTGHQAYAESLKDIGATNTASRPLSVSPQATAASLLAAIPIVAAFLLGYTASLGQLRQLLRLVVVVAFAEILLGLLQISGGEFSPFYFGVLTFGVPVGSFANRNHFANYIAMALAVYVWLAYEAMHHRSRTPERLRLGSLGDRHATVLWVTGGLILVLGILMSRSRGAVVFGLPAAMLGLWIVSLRLYGWRRGWRFALPVALLVVVAAAALLGFEAATSRLTGAQLASSAGFRGELARSTLEGAMAFWPWGSGWGTYDMAYPRFQPAVIAGFANHAHMDYVEMLFEGGLFFVLPAAALVWLTTARAVEIARLAWRTRALRNEAMAATLCGIGLLGLLLHSLVEFNLRIPANAILGGLLAGVYLRPLTTRAVSE